jgi:hypothetical protein
LNVSAFARSGAPLIIAIATCLDTGCEGQGILWLRPSFRTARDTAATQ